MSSYVLDGDKLFTMTTVARDLGITKGAIARLARQGVIAVYENPGDRRQRLVREDQVKAALTPRPISGTVAITTKN